jgi:predicted nuclease of predicted toxin-antitoxin system
VRLLLDQNLSRRLTRQLADDFPGMTHVSEVGLDRATDALVWETARREGYILVTKDTDFDDELRFRGPPPKVIRVAVGNGPTALIEAVIRESVTRIREFDGDDRRELAIGGEAGP